VTPIGWYGVWLLVGSVAVILVEVALMGIWSMRLGRRARALTALIEGERGLIEADVARLRAALDETRTLWRPYARILRWLRHPLVVALIGSYRRRWAAR
jgi:hypothetical protein